MDKPKFRDAVYASFFSGGYYSAAATGGMDKSEYDANKEFYRAMDRGATLATFCHLIDSYFENRKKFISLLDDASYGPIVELIYVARNAFVHCAWVVDKLEGEKQLKTLVAATAQKNLHSKAPNFTMNIDQDRRLHVDGLM